MALDEAKLQTFMGQFVHDLGAVMHAATIVVGDELGLYKALTNGPRPPRRWRRRRGRMRATYASGSPPRRRAGMCNSILRRSSSHTVSRGRRPIA